MTSTARFSLARLQHMARCIHQLGERQLFELLRELDHGADLHSTIERYARLVGLADFIRHYGGDRLPPPVHLIKQSNRGENSDDPLRQVSPLREKYLTRVR